MFKKISLLFLLLTALQVKADERNDIYQVSKDVNYMREVVKQLKRKHAKKPKGKVSFNYDALLAQLNAINSGINEYLSLNIKTINPKPPKPVNTQMYKVRKN